MAGDLLQSILLTAASVGMISVNSLTLTAVYRSKDLRKDISTPFLISLFIADTLQGALAAGMSGIMSWTDLQDLNNIVKKFHAFGLYFTPNASLSSIAALATVKMIAIVWPLRVPDLITMKRTVIILVFVWIIPLLYGMLQFFAVSPKYNYKTKTSWEGYKDIWISFTGIAILLPFFLLLSGSYIIIFIVVIKQTIKIHKQTVPSTDSAIQMPSPILKAFKTSKSIIIVLTVYILLYVVPSMYVFFVTKNNFQYMFWLFWLPYSESFWNCLFYLYFNKAAKNELRKMFHLQPLQVGDQ